MVKMLTNLFNKRKREIERLNGVVKELTENNRQLERVVRMIKSEKDLSERALTSANKSVLDLTHELKYLKMQINTTNNQINSRQY
jgi:peptidoglycan hydrolase CwlO-like protein